MAITKRLTQWLILGLVLSLTAVLAVGIWRGRMQRETEPASVTEKPDAEMRLTDMEYTEMKEGKKLWTLKSSEAKYFQDQQKTHLTSVRLTFFLDDGEAVQLQSDEGVLYAGSKNIELWNSIQAVLPKGYELSTQKAFYDHGRQLIHSETPIQLTGPDIELQGEQWQYSIPDYQGVLDGGVRASVVLLPPETEKHQ